MSYDELGIPRFPKNKKAKALVEKFCDDLDYWYKELKERLEDSGPHCLGQEKENFKSQLCGHIAGFTDKWELIANNYESRIEGKPENEK